MEKGKQTELPAPRQPIVDASAMLRVLDLAVSGPARRAMETVDGRPGDLPGGYPDHDLADK